MMAMDARPPSGGALTRDCLVQRGTDAQELQGIVEAAAARANAVFGLELSESDVSRRARSPDAGELSVDGAVKEIRARVRPPGPLEAAVI